MLNGLAPVILFNFFKLTKNQSDSVATIPIIKDIIDEKTLLPTIPIYLDSKLTGIAIDSESKNIDIETQTETLADGNTPQTSQKGLGSTVTINMVASKSAVGITLIAALMDIIFNKVTSKEYSVSYLNGAVTVFNGLIHKFSINQDSNTDLYTIVVEIIKTDKVQKSNTPQVGKEIATLDVLQQGIASGDIVWRA